jgi:hypothetical protein
MKHRRGTLVFTAALLTVLASVTPGLAQPARTPLPTPARNAHSMTTAPR